MTTARLRRGFGYVNETGGPPTVSHWQKQPVVSRRVAVFGLGTMALSACGFTPVYAPGGQGDGLNGLILADAPTNRDGFVFVGQFEERLGVAQSPVYELQYVIQTRSEGVGITPAAETTRFNLFGGISFKVVEIGSDKTVTSGFVENFTGYSATRLTVSTQTVERDARERLMKILADQVVTRLVTTAPDWRG